MLQASERRCGVPFVDVFSNREKNPKNKKNFIVYHLRKKEKDADARH